MAIYAVTIFLSAFLLFQVQPLIAKIIVPWFGGSAAVWAAALLFFQLVLLAGYAYAHVSIRYLATRVQMILHIALLVASCALLPILPSPAWKTAAAGDPTARILLLLGATVGLPYFLLSSTSPLLQAWFVRRTGSQVPYRLFALSNFGSMLALVSFPFLVEPQFTTKQQAYSWSGGYVLFALLCAFTAWVSRKAQAHPLPLAPVDLTGSEGVAADPPGVAEDRPGFFQLLFWVLLATCASVLLVSVTNHMSQNVAPIPLLWVGPLALYLLTFILSFESDRVYQRWLFLPLLIVALGGMAYMIYAEEGNLTIKWAIPGFAAGLFVACMVCHGEMARRRPAPRYLTLFYLMVSIGGALGGVFVAIIAPRVFPGLWELPIGLTACGALALIAAWNVKLPGFFKKLGAWPARSAFLAGTVVLGVYLAKHEHDLVKGLRLQARNFYGMLQVRDDPPTEDYAERTLLHGTINHGSQLLDPVLRYVTTSYYGKRSGVGRALTALQAKGPIRFGVVGLGTGVLTNYGRKGDYLRVYEINPLVEQLSHSQFTFFEHSAADKQILMGDARLVLENQLKEGSQNYDLLAVDAFSSDAIPVHLLTREAIGLYFKHLKPDGVLALHISNRYLDLQPVCERAAEAFGKQAMTVEDEGEQAPYFSSSTWVLMTANGDFFNNPAFKDAYMYPPKVRNGFRGWTDDYSNLFQILNLK
jgi:hypothetical protein